MLEWRPYWSSADCFVLKSLIFIFLGFLIPKNLDVGLDAKINLLGELF